MTSSADSPSSQGTTAADNTQQIEQALAEAQTQIELYQAVLDSIPSVIYTTNQQGQLLLVNQAFVAWTGRERHEIIGKYQADLFPPELVAYWQGQTDQVVASGASLASEEDSQGDSGTITFLSQRSPLFDAQGAIYAIAGMATDITPLRQAERERELLQSQVIEAQQAALRELSTPLIPIAEGVLVMPLIGSVDSNRAQQLMETLLEGVVEHHATIVILDVTGLPVIDTQVAGVLLRVAQAVNLLGSEAILTGIGPEVAQTLVSIGADLSAIRTPGTLQNGIAYALNQLKRNGAEPKR